MDVKDLPGQIMVPQKRCVLDIMYLSDENLVWLIKLNMVVDLLLMQTGMFQIVCITPVQAKIGQPITDRLLHLNEIFWLELKKIMWVNPMKLMG